MSLLSTKRILRNWFLFHIIMGAFKNNYISSQHGSPRISEIFFETNKKHHKIYARAKLVLAWRTVMTVTSKPRNNHHKAYEVSGEGELLHERQIDIILEMVTALKTKFTLRNKTPHDLFHKNSISKWLQLVPPDSTSKLTLRAKLPTAKRGKAGAELAACNMEPPNQRIIQVGRDLWRVTVQPPPQSTINQSRSQLYT